MSTRPGRLAAERREEWAELDGLVVAARGRPSRLGGAGVRRLGALYRAAVADLAVARLRFPADPVTVELERRVDRARQLVYDTPTSRGSVVDWLTRGFWQRVRERPLALALAVLLLVGPGLPVGVWAHDHPDAAVAVLPGGFTEAGETRTDSGSLGLGLEDQAAMSSQIFTNNIRVTLLTFVGGIAGGLLTAIVLGYNGLLVGLLAGVSIAAGNGWRFAELVLPHGVLELSLIAVGGAAGFRLAGALLVPGHRTRRASLVAETRAAAELALGCAAWLILAGLIEGFVTPRGVGRVGSLVVGAGAAAVFWGLVIWRGRPEPADS